MLHTCLPFARFRLIHVSFNDVVRPLPSSLSCLRRCLLPCFFPKASVRACREMAEDWCHVAARKHSSCDRTSLGRPRVHQCLSFSLAFFRFYKVSAGFPTGFTVWFIAYMRSRGQRTSPYLKRPRPQWIVLEPKLRYIHKHGSHEMCAEAV